MPNAKEKLSGANLSFGYLLEQLRLSNDPIDRKNRAEMNREIVKKHLSKMVDSKLLTPEELERYSKFTITDDSTVFVDLKKK